MSKQDRGNRKARSRGVISSRKTVQPGFDFDGILQPGTRDKFAGSAGVNRIQLASAADLDLAVSGQAVAAVRNPIAFARRLAGMPVRLHKTASGHLLLARAYARLRGIIQHLSKQLLHRQSRSHKLQLLEIQQLGEKRFIAMVRVGKQKFLIGGAATSVSLLAEIDAHKTTVISPRPLDQETA